MNKIGTQKLLTLSHIFFVKTAIEFKDIPYPEWDEPAEFEDDEEFLMAPKQDWGRIYPKDVEDWLNNNPEYELVLKGLSHKEIIKFVRHEINDHNQELEVNNWIKRQKIPKEFELAHRDKPENIPVDLEEFKL